MKFSTTLPPGGESTFALIDERPDHQKVSREDGDGNGKNFHFGDDNLTPRGPELVKTALQTKLNQALAGKSIVLTDFVVTVYEPAINVDGQGIYNSAASVPNGYAAAPLAELMVYAIESIRSEKNLMVQISGKIGNVHFSGAASENFRGRVTESNIRDTVGKSHGRSRFADPIHHGYKLIACRTAS